MNKKRYVTAETANEVTEESWKWNVGAECNRLLDMADHFENHGTGVDDDVAALRSIVSRVAEFEELEIAP